MAELRNAWESDGAGRDVVFVAGEPGIGKSAIVSELANGVYAAGALVLAGRCDEGLAVPYQPFVEALRSHIEHTDDHLLASTLGRWPGELARLVPDLADRLPGLQAPLSSDPQTEQWRLFEAVASWLGTSTDRRVLLVLEDLHWAAVPTLQLLRHVAGSAQVERALVVGTYRDTEVEARSDLAETLAVLRRNGATTVSMRGLDSLAVRALVEVQAGHMLDARGRRLAHVVHEATGGVPLFVREVLAHLVETGAVYQEDGRWTSDLVADQLAVPEIARDVIGRRLSRLDEPVQNVLHVAAVVGQEVELAVLERSVAGLDVLGALELAAAAGLVHEVGPGSYRFSHALIRQALYQEISATRRRQIHATVAAAIEGEYGSRDTFAGALAHHFAEAGTDREKTLLYAKQAGALALAQQAHGDAIRLFELALSLVDPAHLNQRCDLLIELAEARRRSGDETYRVGAFAAGDLARRMGDGVRLARAALVITRPTADMNVDRQGIDLFEHALELLPASDSSLRARAMAALGLKLIQSGPDMARRIQLSDDALAMARRLGDLGTLGSVLSARNNTIWFPDSMATERLANLEEMKAIAGELGDPHLEALAHAFAPSSHIQLGDGAAADVSLLELEKLAHELGLPMFIWVALVQRTMRTFATGHLDEAEALMLEAVAAGDAAAEPDAIVWFGAQLFGLRWFQGRMDEMVEILEPLIGTDVDAAAASGMAIAHLGRGRRDDARALLDKAAHSGFADIPRDATWLGVITVWAYVVAALDDQESAAVLTELLLPFAGQVDVTAALDKGPVSYYLGLLATTTGDFEGAAHWYAAAQELADRLSSVWGPKIRYAWAEMLDRRGEPADHDAAVAMAADGLSIARSWTLPADVDRGQRLVAELTH